MLAKTHRLVQLGCTASLLLVGPALYSTANAGEPIGYSYSGYDYTPQEMATIQAGVEVANRGLVDLNNRNWTSAERNCRAGYDAIVSASMPAKGEGRILHIRMKACMADAFAGQGKWERACHWYGIVNFHSEVVRNPREACARWERSQQGGESAETSYSRPVPPPAPPGPSDYGAAVSGFTGQIRALHGASGQNGRSEQTRLLSAQCDGLWNFRKSNPTARGAADFCMGIVKFEQGNSEEGCQAMWMSARGLDAVRGSPMAPAESSQLAALEQSLSGYRSTCSSKGFKWPGFAEDWPYKS